MACPSCGETRDVTVATSINVGRHPHLQEQILDGSFQRLTCHSCAHPFAVDTPFVCLDFDRGWWVTQYPRAWESRWMELEKEPLQAYRRNLVENAPPMVRAWGQGMELRATFGLDALAEKLLLFAAGLDDRVVEVAKWQLMASPGGPGLHPTRRLRVVGVDEEAVHLLGVRTGVRWTVARERLLDITLDPLSWSAVTHAVAAGPYVDTGRLLLARSSPAHRSP